jgi:urea transport system permease protein
VLVSRIGSLYGARGWAVLGFFALLLIVVMPALHVFVPSDSPLYVSGFTIALVGKIM